jgi:hypothetical protein
MDTWIIKNGEISDEQAISTSISNTLFFLWLGGVMSYCSVRLVMSTKSNFVSCYRTHRV